MPLCQRQKKRVAENEMAGWHHRLNGNELGQTPGDSEEQEDLACCSSWTHRVEHDLATEQQQMPLSSDSFSYLNTYVVF